MVQTPGQPTLFPDWAFAVFGLLAAILCSGLVGAAAIALFGDGLDIRTAVAGQIGLWIGLIGSAALYAKARGMSLRDRVSLRSKPIDICWAALGPVLQVVFSLVYRPFTKPEQVERAAKQVADMAQGKVGLYLLLCVTTVIGAPLVEEIFFRGVLMRAVTGGMSPTTATRKRQYAAIALSAVVFSAVHPDPLLFPALAFFGAVCAVLATVFDRLGPSIWLHVGFNASTMVTMAFAVFRKN
jgi:uncharacterized protein